MRKRRKVKNSDIAIMKIKSLGDLSGAKFSF